MGMNIREEHRASQVTLVNMMMNTMKKSLLMRRQRPCMLMPKSKETSPHVFHSAASRVCLHNIPNPIFPKSLTRYEKMS